LAIKKRPTIVAHIFDGNHYSPCVPHYFLFAGREEYPFDAMDQHAIWAPYDSVLLLLWQSRIRENHKSCRRYNPEKTVGRSGLIISLNTTEQDLQVQRKTPGE
jgi:hypothetical protein